MTAPSLRVFVYGTLRRGGRFHERYCRGVRSIEEGSVRGRLSRLPAGYPVIDVPAADVLARGGRDALADARLLAGIVPRRDVVEGPWSEISGEILTFDDPERRLPVLDELEGFEPGGKSLYHRVALPVRRPDGSLVTAWAYVRGDG